MANEGKNQCSCDSAIAEGESILKRSIHSGFSDDLPKPKTTELLQKGVESIPEYSASEEREESRRWRVFRIGEQEHLVDMKAIEPYKRVISHGGQ